MNEERHLLGALKIGDTAMVCATGYEDGTIVSRGEIPTTTPEATIPAISSWFVGTGVSAVGIGTYGPTAVNTSSPDFGKIIQSKDPSWNGYDLLGTLKATLGVPCGYDTDVNAACLAEVAFGAAQGVDDVVYVTIDTGVGAGLLIDGTPLHGMLHPEAGHIAVTPDPRDPLAQGNACKYHGNCLEGFIALPAIAERWDGKAPAEVADDAEAMDLLAGYLAQGLETYILCYSPRKVVVGGAVAEQTPIVELAREKVGERLSGFLAAPELVAIDDYIVKSTLGGDECIMGCLELARRGLVHYDEHIGGVNL